MFDAYAAHHARLRPAAPAVVTSRFVISFAGLDANVARTAGLLRSLGAGPDRPVAVDVADVYLNWLVTLALARLGVPSAPGKDADCALRVGDRAETEPSLLIGEREIAAMHNGPLPALPRPDRAPEETGRIMLSSGTTGVSKRIALSWRVIDAGIRNAPIAYGVPRAPWLMVNPPDLNLAFTLTLACWSLGLSVLMPDRFPDGASLQAFRPGLVAFLPGQLADLLDALPADFQKQDVRIVTGGGPVSPNLLARTRRALTDDLVSVYGTTECGAVAIATSALLERVPSAAGMVLPGVTLQIVDERGLAVDPGELGHVRVTSDRSAGSYLRGPASAFRDGWFWPGDLGRLDEAGLLCLESRTDDLMNIGGEKIVPGWIEAAARNAPGILEVAAFSLPNADGVERCWLAIVTGDGFDEAALGQALQRPAAILGKIGWLKFDRLPRGASGKVERRLLREATQAWVDRQR